MEKRALSVKNLIEIFSVFWTSSVRRNVTIMLCDSVICALALWLSGVLAVYTPTAPLFLGYLLICAGGFLSTKLYSGIWRYVSVGDILRIIAATSLITLLLGLYILLLGVQFSGSFIAIHWFVMTTALGSARVGYRLYIHYRRMLRGKESNHAKTPILLVGTDDQAELFVREINRQQSPLYHILGILSLKENHVARHIHGYEVLGTLKDLGPVLNNLFRHNSLPQALIVTDPALAIPDLKDLIEEAEKFSLKVLKLPPITEAASASALFKARPISIEELLGREQNHSNRELLEHFIQNKKVLVTGAGGSIGSELVRQIASFNPSELIVTDHNEFALYSIDLELQEKWPFLKRSSFLLDVADRDKVRDLFSKTQPQLVFHAAALKHVPIVENNPLEGIATNAFGSSHVAEACRDFSIETMVLISTDKAINPTNLMGATKRLAEIYCQSLDALCEAQHLPTRYVTVRFGNVLGSNGSVVPLFQKQIERGGPVTVTHPEMTRYFMTIPEAVGLVLKSATLGAHAHEGGKIYVLDMGEPVRILDLAEQMIRLAGFHPDIDIKITFTGLRPGEKLYEELFHEGEELQKTPYESILIGSPRFVDYHVIKRGIEDLKVLHKKGDVDQSIKIVKKFVPEYHPDPVSLGKAS